MPQPTNTGYDTHANLLAASVFTPGAQFYCNTHKQPIWSDGTSWYEADGTVH